MRIVNKAVYFTLLLLILPSLNNINNVVYMAEGDYGIKINENIHASLSGRVWLYLKNYTITPEMWRDEDIQLYTKSADGIFRVYNENTIFSSNFMVGFDAAGPFPYQNEPSIAVNPNNPDNLVVGSHDYNYDPPVAFTSFDGGETWNFSIMELSLPTDWFGSDPALAVDRNGNFYYAYMSIGSMEVTVSYYGYNYTYYVWGADILVSRSVDGGLTWTKYISAMNRNITGATAPPIIYTLLYDKPYIATGPNIFNLDDDIIVISSTRYMDLLDEEYRFVGTMAIVVTVSTDGGLTWSTPVNVSPVISWEYYTEYELRVVQGSMPAIAPNGTIYVAYYDSGEDGWLSGSAYIMVTKSVDGGLTWTNPRVAATIQTELSYYAFPAYFRWWSSMFPIIKVGPDGTVYIVYCDDPDGFIGPDRSDVFLVKSSDGGITWSTPVRINDDKTDNAQFFPWIDVDDKGIIHVIWGDRRLDPADFAYDVYYAKSDDGGDTFSQNMRVTDYSNNPIFGLSSFFIGDYFNIDVVGDNIYVVWTDNRRDMIFKGGFYWKGVQQDIYMAKVGDRYKPKMEIKPNIVEAGQNSIVQVTVKNLSPEANYALVISGDMYTRRLLIADLNGSINISFPLLISSPGSYNISLVNFATNEVIVKSTLNIISSEPLEVKVTVSPQLFRGETAVFTITTLYKGRVVDAVVEKALLITSDGKTINLIENVTKIDTGIYTIIYSIPIEASLGTYTLILSFSYIDNYVNSYGLAITSFTLSEVMTNLVDEVFKLSLAVEEMNKDILSQIDNLRTTIQVSAEDLRSYIKELTVELDEELKRYSVLINMISTIILIAVVITTGFMLKKVG